MISQHSMESIRGLYPIRCYTGSYKNFSLCPKRISKIHMGSLDHYEKKTKTKKAEKAVEISLVDKESDFGG